MGSVPDCPMSLIARLIDLLIVAVVKFMLSINSYTAFQPINIILIMEKHTAHYDLKVIKALVMKKRMAAFTATAQQNARRMGLDASETLAVILGLQRNMLFKSMTTHADHRIWQDVYHAPCPNGKIAYIKLTLQDGAVVIQFKEQ